MPTPDLPTKLCKRNALGSEFLYLQVTSMPTMLSYWSAKKLNINWPTVCCALQTLFCGRSWTGDSPVKNWRDISTDSMKNALMPTERASATMGS